MLSSGERAQARQMGSMFGRLAHRYDLVNRVISLGQDQRWRKAALAEICPPASTAYLDLAAGTGDLTLLEARAGGRVVAVELCPDMLRRARAKLTRAGVAERTALVLGHGLALPFQDGAFEVITVGFALRNIPNLPALFRECRRVLKPGGRLVSVELTRCLRRGLGLIYRFYLLHFVPALGRWLAQDGQAYRYLAHSLTPFPAAPQLSHLLAEAGFQRVSYRLLAGGAIAIHIGWK